MMSEKMIINIINNRKFQRDRLKINIVNNVMQYPLEDMKEMVKKLEIEIKILELVVYGC